MFGFFQKNNLELKQSYWSLPVGLIPIPPEQGLHKAKTKLDLNLWDADIYTCIILAPLALASYWEPYYFLFYLRTRLLTWPSLLKLS